MKRKSKKDIQDAILIVLLVLCGIIGFLFGFVILDFGAAVGGAVAGGITAALYVIIAKYILRVKKPFRFIK